VQCVELGSPPNPKASYQTRIEGTGILPNTSSCYIQAENFKLLPHSIERTVVNLTKAHVVLPNIENIIHISEETLLQTDTQHSVELSQLDGIVVRATSRGNTQGLDVSRVVTALRGREVYHSPSHKTCILGIIVAFAGLGNLRIVLFTNTGICWPWVLLHSRHISKIPNQTLNEPDVGLQVELGRDEENPEVTSEEVPKGQSQPTVFVRHGRMVVDHP
jgi:hypothetical protein